MQMHACLPHASAPVTTKMRKMHTYNNKRSAELAKDSEIRLLVGGAIAVRRRQLGMGQGEAAVMLGIDQGSLSRIEKGRAPATVTMLTRIAPVLHTSAWLLVAQAVGTPQERYMAEQIQHLMTTRPAVWETVRILLRHPVGETIP